CDYMSLKVSSRACPSYHASWQDAIGQAIASGLFVRRSTGPGQILRPDLFDIEFGRTLAHGLQYFFQRRRLALDPAQCIDARHHERAQIRAHESALFEFFVRRSYPLLEVKQHGGALLVIFYRDAQRVLREGLKPPQDGMVHPATEARYPFIADPKRNQGRLVEIKSEL